MILSLKIEPKEAKKYLDSIPRPVKIQALLLVLK
jgi:hypothetical protein